MGFFDFFTNIFTGILVGYLALTNVLADKIALFLPQAPVNEIAIQKETSTESPTLEKLTELSKTFAKGTSRILLDHAEYQRAATIASVRNDEFLNTIDDQPTADVVKGALVNIYCQYKTNEYIRTTTGTGFFINPKGVILTNAHVAQFLLLKDTKDSVVSTECVIRTGDPATSKYHAELLYISPTWIFENADLITNETPRGTGERDYALLYISKSIDSTPLPTRFSSLPVDVALLSRNIIGASVMTAGYPAGALARGGADAELTPVIASTTIRTLYTFGSNYADIFSISESPVGEEGASGGPIVTESDTDAIGLIVTKGDTDTEGAHSLRAITLSYVDRTIIEETGFSLLQNMQGDVAYRGNIFKKAMVPFLAGILEDELGENAD